LVSFHLHFFNALNVGAFRPELIEIFSKRQNKNLQSLYGNLNKPSLEANFFANSFHSPEQEKKFFMEGKNCLSSIRLVPRV